MEYALPQLFKIPEPCPEDGENFTLYVGEGDITGTALAEALTAEKREQAEASLLDRIRREKQRRKEEVKETRERWKQGRNEAAQARKDFVGALKDFAYQTKLVIQNYRGEPFPEMPKFQVFDFKRKLKRDGVALGMYLTRSNRSWDAVLGTAASVRLDLYESWRLEYDSKPVSYAVECPFFRDTLGLYYEGLCRGFSLKKQTKARPYEIPELPRFHLFYQERLKGFSYVVAAYQAFIECCLEFGKRAWILRQAILDELPIQERSRAEWGRLREVRKALEWEYQEEQPEPEIRRPLKVISDRLLPQRRKKGDPSKQPHKARTKPHTAKNNRSNDQLEATILQQCKAISNTLSAHRRKMRELSKELGRARKKLNAARNNLSEAYDAAKEETHREAQELELATCRLQWQKTDALDYKAFLEQHYVHRFEDKARDDQNPRLALRRYQAYIKNLFPSLAEAAERIIQQYNELPEDPEEYVEPPPQYFDVDASDVPGTVEPLEITFDPFPVHIAEKDRRRHSYVSGSSGSGKTEFLKTLIYSYVVRPHYGSVVVIDPHGDLADQIVHWKEFAGSENLIYIHPFLADGITPTFNPFHIGEVDDPHTYDRSVDIMAQELTRVIEEVAKQGGGGSLTGQMSVLIKHCIEVVIRMGGDLYDLQRFMIDGSNQDLVGRGKRLPNPAAQRFFQDLFYGEGFRTTKIGLWNRIQLLLSTHAFFHLVTGQSTFDLEAALDSRKVIVFNLSQGELGKDASHAYGRFIIASIQGIALRRARIPEGQRVPVHLFVDECQNFVTDSVKKILEEARKYRLYLTLAQQQVGANMDTALLDSVLGNSNLLFTGGNSNKSLSRMARETGAPTEDLKGLREGKFSLFVRSNEAPAFPFKAPATLLGSSNTMSAEEWERVKADQVERYYRTKDHTPPQAETIPRNGRSRLSKYALPE